MSDETADRIGTVLGERYALDELLGSGGMGAVYGGRHVITDAKVAIQVLHRQFSNN